MSIFYQISCGSMSIFSIRSAVHPCPYFPSGQLWVHVHIFHQVSCASMSIFSISHLWVHIHIFHQVSCGFMSIFSIRSAVGPCPYFSWYSLDTATASIKVIVIFRRHKWSRQRKRDRQTVNYIETEKEREKTPESWLPIQPAWSTESIMSLGVTALASPLLRPSLLQQLITGQNPWAKENEITFCTFLQVNQSCPSKKAVWSFPFTVYYPGL